MTFSVRSIPGVTTPAPKCAPEHAKQPHVAAAIVFNSKAELWVRSEHGSEWYRITQRGFGLACECTASHFGRVCRHINGDRKRGTKGAAAFLESLDPARLRGAQLDFYWGTVQDPARKEIRARRARPTTLEAAY